MDDDEVDARKELRRIKKQIEREKRRAREVADKPPDEVADLLLPDLTLTLKW